MGNYDQLAGSLLSLEIGGLIAGTQYDQLIVTGNLNLAGMVEVTFLNEFQPRVGDTFDILSAGGNLVRPEMMTFPNAPTGFAYSTAMGGGMFSLTVTAVSHLSCDLNGDLAADAADAGLMFGNWGNPVTGDCNSDGIVDAADAGILFGEWTGDVGPSAVASIPEPSSWTIILVLLIRGVRLKCFKGQLQPFR